MDVLPDLLNCRTETIRTPLNPECSVSLPIQGEEQGGKGSIVIDLRRDGFPRG